MIELNNINSSIDAQIKIQSQWLGLLDYQEALDLQYKKADEVRDGKNVGFLLGLHHPTIITLGKRADTAMDIPSGCHLPMIEIDRGGQATLHSPGQLVIYPILNLRELHLEVRSYVKLLEKATVEFLAGFQVKSFTTEQSGVFTENGKIAFIGVRVDRGITRHGISINISNDISLFQNIRSCGVSQPKIDLLANYHSAVALEDTFELWFKYFLAQLK